jgi:biopolymer transport protein ExbB
MGIEQQFSMLAMTGVHWVLWLLVGIFILALGVTVERGIYLLTSKDDMRRLRRDLLVYLGRGDVVSARKRLEESPSFEARIAMAGLEGISPVGAEERLSAAAALARLEMERNVGFLGTVGTNAPFIGLLGTVMGVIRAFHGMSGPADTLFAPLMGQIAEALVATGLGLLVAVPAFILFNLFHSIIKTRLSQAEALGKDVLAHLKMASERGLASGRTLT